MLKLRSRPCLVIDDLRQFIIQVGIENPRRGKFKDDLVFRYLDVAFLDFTHVYPRLYNPVRDQQNPAFAQWQERQRLRDRHK